MKPLPSNQLDLRVKNVWRINDAIWVTAIMLFPLVTFYIFTFFSELVGIGRFGLTISFAVWVFLLVLFILVLPPVRFIRWRYEITPEYLDIAKGILWRKRYIIPFIRVQNTDTRQGPVLRMFGLSSVTVSTAASEHVIPGLDVEVAEELRDRAAEFARIAREDV